MFEYKTQTFYSQAPPETLIPPEQEFRLRDIKAVCTGGHTDSVKATEFSSVPGGCLNIPYISSQSHSNSFAWIVIWEKYVPEEENE